MRRHLISLLEGSCICPRIRIRNCVKRLLTKFWNLNKKDCALAVRGKEANACPLLLA